MEVSTDTKTEIERLSMLRHQSGLSYAQIAERSGVPLSTVQKVFCHVTAHPRKRTLDAIRRVLYEDALEARLPGTCSTADDAGPVRGVHLNEAGQVVSFDGTGSPHITTYLDTKPAEYFWLKEAAYSDGETPLSQRRGCSLTDYLNVPEDRRVELIDGQLYDMAAPTTAHQVITYEIWYQLRRFIDEKGGSCRPMGAPFDVQLDDPAETPPEQVHTILQPDIAVFCRPEQIGEKRAYLAPDLIIEVLSPSTRKRDMSHKLWKYQRAGVREYWMVDPQKEKIIVYDWMDDGECAIYGFEDAVPVAIYQGELQIEFAKIRALL